MGRLSIYARHRILAHRNHVTKIEQIRLALLSEDICVTRQTISNFLKKFSATGSINDLHRSGRIPILKLQHLNYIDQCMNENPENSARDLQAKLIEQFNISISVSTIKRIRNNLGWIYTGTRYAQMIRHVNRPLRQVFCLHSLAARENFDDIIFTDESSIPIGTSLKKCFRRRGEPRQLIAKPKHPLKVHVWAGISARGATSICIFRGIMDADFYRQILQTHLLPFIQHTYPDGHRFQQDNDPKHVSHATLAWLIDNGVNYWPTPAESPDLNPIENIWAALKRYIYKTVKPTTLDQLVGGIQEYWLTLTPEICQRYIVHLQKVMPVVIARGGAASGM